MNSPLRFVLTSLCFALIAAVAPQAASAIEAGINIDIHQDLNVPPAQLPTGFYISGRLESGPAVGEPGGGGWSQPAVLIDHVDGIFTQFTYGIAPDPTDPGENWYTFWCQWELPPASPGVPFCTTVHLGLLFDLTCHNVVIDVSGVWTFQGQPIPLGVNQGFVPIPGFRVVDNEQPQLIHLQNGNANGTPEPGEIETQIVQMDLLAVGDRAELEALLGPDPFRELREGGLEGALPWVPVFNEDEPISETNPWDFPAESFFDVFFEIPSGPLYPEFPVPVQPGGFLLARERVQFINNAGMMEQRWVWEYHEAHQAELGDAPDSSNSWGVGMTTYPLGIAANFPTVFQMGSPPHGPIHYQPLAAAYLGPVVTLEIEADLLPDQDGVTNIDPPNNLADQDVADDGVLGMPLALPHCAPASFQFVVTSVNPVDPMFVNVWFDWNRDADWDDILDCGPSGPADEWAVQNMIVSGLPPNSSTVLTTPSFLSWHPTAAAEPIWMRITLSEQPRQPGAPAPGYGGDGPVTGFQFGETEDYYFTPREELYPKWRQPPHDQGEGFDAASDLWLHEIIDNKVEQLPDPSLPGLHAHDWFNPPGPTVQITLADDWVCDGGDIITFEWWGNYELDGMGMEQRGLGVANFHLSIHQSVVGVPWSLPAGVEIWGLDVPFALAQETDTGLINVEGCRIYHYTFVLPAPFMQEQGMQYWFDIETRSIDPGNPAIWRWQEARRDVGPPLELAPAANRTTVQGSPPGPWSSIIWPPIPPSQEDRFTDLAFRVVSAPLPVPEVNKVVADDFVSDGRPIESLRWWGSYFDERYEPAFNPDPPYQLDGWLISFHHSEPAFDPACPPNILAGDPHPTVLGVYFAGAAEVSMIPTGMTDCFGHEVYEYEVALADCCLICAEADPRDGGVAAFADAFLERHTFGYWLDVQAVTGAVWRRDASMQCNLEFTGHLPSDITPDAHFWGWHTSSVDLLNEACTGRIVDFSPYPPNCWDYGDWIKQPWLCPIPPQPVNMSFELLTSAVRGDCNGDGVVDLLDYAALAGCVTGPNAGPIAVGCECCDLDVDNDVDLYDFTLFEIEYP